MGKWSDIPVQSVGILPMPASLMILPYIESWDRHIDNILSLRLENTPPQWSFLKYVITGELDKAKEAMEVVNEKEVKLYNLAILSGSEEDIEKTIRVLKDQLLVSLLENLLNLGRGQKLKTDVDTDRRDIQALLSLMRSVRETSSGNRKLATEALDEAVKLIKGLSPVFEAHLLYKKALLIFESKGENYHLLSLYEEILKTLKDTKADWLKGEIYFQMGNMFSTFGNLHEAIKHYNLALEHKDRDKERYTWALIQNNKGLAYLSIPVQDVEDHMRLAYGVQCLKKALEVFTKKSFPEEWASATLNYANALQYLPTADPVKNLLKAIELYKEVAHYREQKGDREGYARALANMGNALAHLGRLDEAKDKLITARRTFMSMGMSDEVSAIDEIMNEIKSVEATDGYHK